MTLGFSNLYAAAPYGLAAQYVYNGLRLNANKGAVSSGAFSNYAYVLQEIGGMDSPDRQVRNEQRPDFDGETPTIETLGGRTLTLQGYIWAINPEQCERAEVLLRKALSPVVESALYVDVGSPTLGDVYITCRPSQGLQARRAPKQREGYRRDFLITLRASDPRFLAYTASSATSGTAPPSGTNIACSNSGNYRDYPVLTITGPFNAGLTITNSVTGDALVFSSAIVAGTVLTIDCLRRTVKNAGGLNYYAYLSSASGFPTIESGAQNLTLTGVAGTTGASLVGVAWRHAFI